MKKRPPIKYWRRSSRWRDALSNAKNRRHRSLLLTLAEGLNPFEWRKFLEFAEESQAFILKQTVEKLSKRSPLCDLLESSEFEKDLGQTIRVTVNEQAV